MQRYRPGVRFVFLALTDWFTGSSLFPWNNDWVLGLWNVEPGIEETECRSNLFFSLHATPGPHRGIFAFLNVLGVNLALWSPFWPSRRHPAFGGRDLQQSNYSVTHWVDWIGGGKPYYPFKARPHSPRQESHLILVFTPLHGFKAQVGDECDQLQ